MPQLSLFPKFCTALSLDELPGRVAETGLDAVNLLIRPGYWVTPDDVLETAPRFVQAIRGAGLAVDFCTWCALPEQILADEDTLRLFADLGIKGFRLGYYPRRDGVPLSVQLREANEDLHFAVRRKDIFAGVLPNPHRTVDELERDHQSADHWCGDAGAELLNIFLTRV